MSKIIIGSRGSKLALWQTNWVKSRLEKAHPELTVEIEIIKTTGDKQAEASLLVIGGKGVFTKEIEEALIERRIDLAVHSLKDLPTALPDGLHLAAVTEREDVRDALLVNQSLRKQVTAIKDLPLGARVGTSSLRRRAQLLYVRPDLQILELRGNVDTRLRKLESGDYEAIILASAGLIRLGFGDHITQRIDVEEMLTAVGQAALGIETRVEDYRTNLLLKAINHWPTRYAAEAERSLLRELGGGCAVPIAALGRVKKERTDGRKIGKLFLEALVADADGKKVLRQTVSGPVHQAKELGAQLAQTLIAAGARELLPRIGSESPAPVQTPPTQPVIETTAEPAEPAEETAPMQPEPPALAAPEVATSAPEPPKTQTNGVLANRRVIVTRPVKQSGELVEALQELGAEVIACPTIMIKEPTSWERLDRALKHLSWYDWLAFTSANGVEYFLRRLDELGHHRAELESHKVCAVGQKTAEKLKSEGIMVDLMPERFTAEALVEDFINRFGERRRLEGAQMLLPASQTTRDVIRPALDAVGVYVEVVEAYQTVLPAKSNGDVGELIRNARANYIIFTSPSTIANLATLLETDHLAPHLMETRVACIGPVTAEAARLHGLEVHIQPDEHTAPAIVKSLVTDSQKLNESSSNGVQPH